MGLDVNGVKLLLRAHYSGVAFTSVMMLGRQSINIAPADRKRLGRSTPEGVPADRLLRALESPYAEDLLALLGAREIVSLDASPYEQASLVHDMNKPIPDHLKGRFSLVLDGGTLEHVFNFPIAIQNCMEMTAVGGCCLIIAPTNNFTGHGFYQFSPELYFRVFSEPNGFRVEDMIVYGDGIAQSWYRVADPNEVRARVLLMNGKPTYISVLAHRIAAAPMLIESPQQSDYVELWRHAEFPAATHRSHFIALARAILPGWLRDSINHCNGRWRFGVNHRHYVRLKGPFDRVAPGSIGRTNGSAYGAEASRTRLLAK